MGTMTLWDRVWPWLRHPLSTAAAIIAFRFVEDHPDLEIRFKSHVVPVLPEGQQFQWQAPPQAPYCKKCEKAVHDPGRSS